MFRFLKLATVASAFLLIAPLASAQFTTVLNIPDVDPDIGFQETIDSNTQLNLSEGGSIGDYFNAGNPDGTSTNVEVNVSGGNVGKYFNAAAGSVVNITGGEIDRDLIAGPNSTVNIFGGTHGIDSFFIGINDYDYGFIAKENSNVTFSGGYFLSNSRFYPESNVKLIGSEFYLNGTSVEDLETLGSTLQLDVPPNSVLSGTLSDGSPFLFSNIPAANNGDIRNIFSSGVLTIEKSEPIDSHPQLIEVASDDAPLFATRNQTINLEEGGRLGNKFLASHGTVVNINGGWVGPHFIAVNSQVNIRGGQFNSPIEAYENTEINIYNGVRSRSGGVRTFRGSVVNHYGGIMRGSYEINSGSTLNVYDHLTSILWLNEESTVNLFNGTVYGDAQLKAGVTLNLLSEDAVMSGEIFQYFDYRSPDDPATGPIYINVQAGSITKSFGVGHESEVNLSGGFIESVWANNSTVNMSGGSFNRLGANESVVNFSGGVISSLSFRESILNIYGGEIAIESDLSSGNQINLFGSKFLLNGNEIDGLSAGQSVTLEHPYIHGKGSLIGVLANGSYFDYSEFFHVAISSPDSIQLTLMPEDFLAGDYNADGKVDTADYTVWRNSQGENASEIANNFHAGVIGQPGYDTWLENFSATLLSDVTLAGDYNQDGVVNAADYTLWRDNIGAVQGSLPNDPHGGFIGQMQYETWVANYGMALAENSTTSTVPEPSALFLLLLSLAAKMPRRVDS